MKLRPTIFLSGVSSEFGSFRDAVADEILRKGCYPLNQPTFGVDYRDIETILREKLSEADAVIHIAGLRFGDEPKGRPSDKPRRSYTQLEFDIARQLDLPVYLFLSADATVRDAASSNEDLERTDLQLAHRQAIENGNPQYRYFRDKDELCRLVAGLKHVAQTDFRVDISRIIKYAPAELIGREQELALLNEAWLKVRRAESHRPHVLTFVGLGGEGKTSLVAKWLADLAFQNWPGCDSAFAWSFYSQGTREQYAAYSDLFLKEAITFFGNDTDKEFAASAAGAYEKGQRLARIVGQRRALLILDGLEPLQYAPTSPTPGELKDAGISALLKGVAANTNGLCIVTTRYSLPNLKAFWQTTAPEIPLTRLSLAAGIHLLKTLGVRGLAKEFEDLVEDVKGHALTLNLLGTYLRDAHGGDIRRRDLIKLEEADAEEQGGHAFRVMEAYERAFEAEGGKGERVLVILRLLGLFDGPVSEDCLAALLEKPAIVGLTDSFGGWGETQRNLIFKRLEKAKLLTVNWGAFGVLVSIDAHPLLREYFARQLRTSKPETWRAAHRRLYEHLCATTPDKPQPTIEDLQPLYQAVAHGCQAGLQQQACADVFRDRIHGPDNNYSTRSLGAFGLELGAAACFFESPWNQVSQSLSDAAQGWVLGIASYALRSLGRLVEAIQPTRAGIPIKVRRKDWSNAATNTLNLSDLFLVLGQVADAVKEAKRSVTYADYSGEAFCRIIARVTHGGTLHEAGLLTEAEMRFREAEKIHVELQPEYPLLYSLQGFRYCDLLLDAAETDAWQQVLELGDPPRGAKGLRTVNERTVTTFDWWSNHFTNASSLDLAVEQLTLGRVGLYKLVSISTSFPLTSGYSEVQTTLDDAVTGLRRAGIQIHVPRGLLSRAWLRFLTGARIGPESAQEDLDEAWEIAERGPMRLHMADIHLYRARLFFREKEYPWESAEADLKAARKLIEQCGYWRRKEELEDAERVILKKSA